MMTSIEISGFVVGEIWWPVGAECFKPFRHDVVAYARRCDGATLRDHILEITRDGDFQGCTIAQGEITITLHRPNRRRSRTWPLDRFPSVSDCLHEDPDWHPVWESDDD